MCHKLIPSSFSVLSLYCDILRRTINIFLGADDISLAIHFFEDFLSTMDKFPPLSLSTYWTRTGDQVCLVDIPSHPHPQMKSASVPPPPPPTSGDNEDEHNEYSSEKKEKEKEQQTPDREIRLLSHPELAYLNINSDEHEGPKVDDVDYSHEMLASPNGNNSVSSFRDHTHESAAMAANLLDHDPLGVIQKLFDVTECLALAIPPSDRHVLLSVGLTIGMKAGRAALLLGAASVLASSESVLNDTDIDIKVLRDMKTFVANINNKKSYFISDNANTKKTNEGESKKSDKIEGEREPESSTVPAKEMSHANKNEAYNLLKESISR